MYKFVVVGCHQPPIISNNIDCRWKSPCTLMHFFSVCVLCCACSLMPLKAVVDESESEASLDLEPRPGASRKRKAAPERVDKSTETFLRSLLGKQCPCKKKTCMQQFIEPKHFESLMAYRKHWFELEKLDQDNLAPQLLLAESVVCFWVWCCPHVRSTHSLHCGQKSLRHLTARSS